MVGSLEGAVDGLAVVGMFVGKLDGLAEVGASVGILDGFGVGSSVGAVDGLAVVGMFTDILVVGLTVGGSAFMHALLICPAYADLQQASCEANMGLALLGLGTELIHFPSLH